MLLLFSSTTLPARAVVAQTVVEAATAGTAHASVTQAFAEALTSLRPNTGGQPAFVIVGHPDVVPAPALTALVQAGAYVKAVVARPAFTGLTPITLLRLYRAPSSVGPWTLVDAVAPSPISALNHLFDLNPAVGHAFAYVATAVDAVGTESAPSAARSLSARA